MDTLLNIFKALSDETRLRILKLIEKGEMCVCELSAVTGLIQPKISFHLGVLKNAGLIRDRKEGKWIYYSIDDSDLFRRFLILSVIERMPEERAQDRRRARVGACLPGKEGKRKDG